MQVLFSLPRLDEEEKKKKNIIHNVIHIKNTRLISSHGFFNNIYIYIYIVTGSSSQLLRKSVLLILMYCKNRNKLCIRYWGWVQLYMDVKAFEGEFLKVEKAGALKH